MAYQLHNRWWVLNTSKKMSVTQITRGGVLSKDIWGSLITQRLGKSSHNGCQLRNNRQMKWENLRHREYLHVYIRHFFSMEINFSEKKITRELRSIFKTIISSFCHHIKLQTFLQLNEEDGRRKRLSSKVRERIWLSAHFWCSSRTFKTKTCIEIMLYQTIFTTYSPDPDIGLLGWSAQGLSTPTIQYLLFCSW